MTLDKVKIIFLVNFFSNSKEDWFRKALMPTPRSGAAAAVVNNKIYVIGGYNCTTKDCSTPEEVHYLSLNECYNPETDTWTTLAPMPTGRSAAAAGVLNNKIYVIGGYYMGIKEVDLDKPHFLCTNEEYDISLNRWTSKLSMFTPRGGCIGGVINDKIYIIGGYNDKDGYLTLNQEYTIQ